MVKLLLYFLILILPLGQLTRLPLGGGEIGVYLHDLIIVLLLINWGLRKFFKKEEIIWPKITRFILAFAGLAAFSLLLAIPYFLPQELLVASLYLVRWISYVGIYFVLFDGVKQKTLTMTSQPLILAGISASLLGLAQYFIFPDIRPLTQFDWDPHYFRVVGTLLDPGFTGLIYVLTLTLLVPKLWRLKPRNFKSLFLSKNILWLLAALLVYLSLALTYARSAYLAYLVAMGIISWPKRSVKFFLAVLLWGVMTLVLLPRPGGEGVRLERHSTILARLNNYQQTIKIGWQKPLFGWGFNTYRYVQKNLGLLDEETYLQTHAGAGADASLLFVFATTGAVGLISYFFLFYGLLQSSQKDISIVASLGAVLIHSFFNNSLFYAWVMIWLWLLLGFKENRKQ